MSIRQYLYSHCAATAWTLHGPCPCTALYTSVLHGQILRPCQIHGNESAAHSLALEMHHRSLDQGREHTGSSSTSFPGLSIALHVQVSTGLLESLRTHQIAWARCAHPIVYFL